MTRLSNETAGVHQGNNIHSSPRPSGKGPSLDRPQTADAGLQQVEIIIPIYNQVDYTKQCLASLYKNSPATTRVTVIDNGSSDGTGAYLAGVPGLNMIRNDKNRGCAAAWNQGVQASVSNWILFLNNDVLLTPRWMEGLISAAVENGLDIASPAMREGPLNYKLEEYARQFVSSTSGAARPGVAHGVCFLVRRRVFDAVGLFDENFRFGQFEDKDFFYRAREAGFALGATGRSFVHHFGSVTQDYVRRKLPLEAYEEWNREYYRSKWSQTWSRRCLSRWKMKAMVAWWRTWELQRCGHSLAERWRRDGLTYE